MRIRAHHVIEKNSKGFFLAEPIRETIENIKTCIYEERARGEQLELVKYMVIDELTRNWSLLNTGWSYKYDMLGEKLVNLPNVAGAILEIAYMILYGQSEQIITLSVFPEDPICDACYFGRHCFELISANSQGDMWVERVKDNKDAQILGDLVSFCAENSMGVNVLEIQREAEKDYPVRVEISLRDLRKVVGVEG